jgi:hypothetical protein
MDFGAHPGHLDGTGPALRSLTGNGQTGTFELSNKSVSVFRRTAIRIRHHARAGQELLRYASTMPATRIGRNWMRIQRACVTGCVRTLVVASGFGIAGVAIADPPSRALASPAGPHGRVPPGMLGGAFTGAAADRRPAERAVGAFRKRGADQVRDLRRQFGDEVRRLGVPALQTPGRRAAPWSPFLPEKRSSPAPVLAGEQDRPEAGDPHRAACRLDERTVCLASGAGTLALWCARRHLVFEVPPSAPARSAACPESAIEAVWLRGRGARAATRIEPGPCPAMSACGHDPGPGRRTP